MISIYRAARRFSVALALVAFAACGDETAPAPTTTQDIEITNVFATSSPNAGAQLSRATFAEAAVQITKIRLKVYETPGDKILFDSVFTVDPSQSKWTLPFRAPVGATVRITSELISVTAGVEKVEYSGQAGPVTLNPCTTTCAPIPIKNYPGPLENLGATGVTLSPDAPTVVEGSTVNLTAATAPAGTTFQVNWRSLNTAVATVSATGVVTGVTAGTASIIAAVASRADTVAVTVTVANTCTETAYTVGSTANASWTAGDCVFAASGRRYDMYAMTLAQQTSFTAAVTGPAGRRVQVRRAGTTDYVQVMAGEAAMPAASNPLTIGYILPAGSYVIEVATPDATTLGAYTLATTVGAAASCSVLTFVWPTVTITGAVSTTDCASPVGTGREDRYIVLPNAGVRLAMSVATSVFAPGVYFRDARQGPASPTLAYDSQLDIGSPAKVAYTTTFAGFHEVIVTHSNAAGTGAYTLNLATESATNTCVPIASDVSRRLAVWESTDCAANGRIHDKYSFTIDPGEQEAFKFSLSGAAATKSAGVFRNGVEVLDWSNGSSADLNAAWLLEPGTYEFRVGAPAASAGVAYTFTATDITEVTCTNNGTSGNVQLPGQSLGGTDCLFNGRYEDRLALYVAAGKDIEVTMTGTTVAPTAVIRDPASAPGTVLAIQTSTTPATVTTTYRTTVTGYYQVIFTSNAQNATGSYSGSIVIR